jgi:hypothetical protein
MPAAKSTGSQRNQRSDSASSARAAIAPAAAMSPALRREGLPAPPDASSSRSGMLRTQEPAEGPPPLP